MTLVSSQDLNVPLSFRDGSPYCEKDYQGLFGVKCEACHQFITGKVLEVSDRGPLRPAALPTGLQASCLLLRWKAGGLGDYLKGSCARLPSRPNATGNLE